MPVIIDQVVNGVPGDGSFAGSCSPDGQAAVVFEDDGETGYLYACESAGGPILDALHVFNVQAVADRHTPSVYKIGWAPSFRHAVLLINGQPHAVFDFDLRQGWCRSGFPPPAGDWSPEGHSWNENCLNYFR